MYLTYLSGKEPIERVCVGKAGLGSWLDEPAVYHIQAVQSDLLLLQLTGGYSSVLPVGVRGDIRLTALWLAAMCLGVLTELLTKPVGSREDAEY